MKSNSPYLFDLIKSLTNSEKRYFSLFAQRHYPEDNHSLRLFHIVGKQDKYAEKEAMEKAELSKNNFAVQKNILYNQILTALIQYDEAGSLAIKLQHDVFACQKLMQKGLLSQVKTKIKQVKTDAEKYEMHEIALQALQIESAMHAREQYKNISVADLEDWYKENIAITEKINTEAFFKFSISRVQKIQLNAGGKNAASAAQIKEILTEIKAKEPQWAMTQKAQMDRLQIEALYYFLSEDTERAFATNENFIALMESQRHWILLFPQRYFSALNNYLIDCFVLKKEKELRTGLEKMRLLKDNPAFKKTANLEPNIFRISYQVELNYLISQGEFSKAVEILSEVKTGLSKYQGKIPLQHQMNMEYLTTYVLFGAGQYAEASQQLDKLQQYSRNETAALIDDVVSIMQVVCHYEMKNYSILDSLVKSCKRKLNDHKKAMSADLEFDVLNAILSFSVKEATPKDWQKVWQKICQKSNGEKPHTPHNDYFNLFNYVYAQSEKKSYEMAWNN